MEEMYQEPKSYSDDGDDFVLFLYNLLLFTIQS